MIKFILQDCLKGMKDMPNNLVSSYITSPPYNLGIKYGKYQDSLPRDSYLQWLNDIAIEMKRTLKDNGSIFLNIGYTNNDPWVAMDVANIFRQYFILQNNITWVKHIQLDDGSTHGIYKPINSNRYTSPTNESLFHFTHNGNVKVFPENISLPKVADSKYPDNDSYERWERTSRRAVAKSMGFRTIADYIKSGRNREEFNQKLAEHIAKRKPYNPNRTKDEGNTWYIPYIPISKLAADLGAKTGNKLTSRGGHPATFPSTLPEKCIKFIRLTPSDLVVDPFMGTGSTAVACKQLDIKCIGFDIDADYLAFAKERLK